LLLLCGAAKAAPPPPFVMTEPNQQGSITVYSDYLEDTNRKLSLDDIRQSGTGERFHPAAHPLQRLGFSDHPWWLRVALRNETGSPRTRHLVASTGPVAQLSLYAPADDGTYQSRAPLPADYDRFLPYNKHIFRVTLPPDTTRVYYLRVLPDHGFHYSLELTDEAAELATTTVQASVFWLLSGLVTGLALMHLILFGVLRSPVYGAYALFFALLTLVVMSYSGLLNRPAWLPQGGHAQWSAFLILLGLAAHIGLGYAYLQVPVQLPGFKRPLRAFMIALVATAPVVLFWVPIVPALVLSYGTAAVVALALFWLGIYAWQQNTAGAGLYVLGRAGITLTSLLVIAAVQQWYALQWNFPLLLMAAGTLEAVVLAIGLQRGRETRLREKLRRQQQQQLDHALREARQDTLARVSHEVRTPMSGIMGMAEILEETPLTPHQREYIRAIQAAGNDLLRVVGDVLMFSGEAGTPARPQPEPFALTPCVMEALDLFRERAEEKNIELIPHIHAHVPAQVQGDADRLRQVLVNLLACVARHGQPGELMVDVARDPTGRGGYLRFELSGSTLRETEAIWSALDTETHSSGAGDSTALGLSSARQLVESMDGELQWRYDRHGRPLCRFSLPLPEANTHDTGLQDVDLNGFHLLIIDDSPTVGRVIRQQALSWGMRVTVTHDPREALATIRTQANIRDPFDVVILDQQMPGMDGLELAERIREDAAGQALALIMLSGVQSSPSRQAVLQAGLQEVLTKPVSGARLRRSLAGALGLLAEPSPPTQAFPPEPEPALRLLVAEDDPLGQQVIQGMLNRLGMTAEVVNNGREAVAAVRAHDYDLILMDCEMPEMDGFEAARAIRTLETEQQRGPVPIIALTAHILREHRERSQAADMNAHVPKPVELAVLREVISRFAGSAARRPGTSPASDETPG
jgi:CheY-like chemotaxis protein/signal transduction histidine kinase